MRTRLRARVDSARVDADDVTPEVVSGLVSALEQHQAAYSPNAYLTGLARRSLATAYRQRGVASPDSVASHRREARALLLLGAAGKARASMDFARQLESGFGEA